MRLTPYALCAPQTARAALDRLAGAGLSVEVFDVADEAHAPFFHLVNAANAVAFGGLGMPLWVQLDCCTLPSVMVGFCAPAADVDPALRALLGERAGVGALRDDQPVPVSEFCALPSLEPGAVVGVSLFSLRPGLGARSKALGWLALGARRHVGVTQYRNRAVRAHCRLGPLEVLTPAVPVHDLGPQTFLYQALPPDAATLRGWVDAPPLTEAEPPDLDGRLADGSARLVDLDLPPPDVAAAVASAQAAWGKAFICAPGHVLRGSRPHLLLSARPAPWRR